ncbi:hypothetical protein BpHYR1_036079 [Brachionus plicatilis]|uniref:Uncharacterized protein n=1 Tax=Brachionus plicatilis TaxID=10195 RepID=A0A3M7R972_BRAPC|nr:hypothetical protein BpHYR1_036079 [Brachionus plicatilis]
MDFFSIYLLAEYLNFQSALHFIRYLISYQMLVLTIICLFVTEMQIDSSNLAIRGFGYFKRYTVTDVFGKI